MTYYFKNQWKFLKLTLSEQKIHKNYFSSKQCNTSWSEKQLARLWKKRSKVKNREKKDPKSKIEKKRHNLIILIISGLYSVMSKFIASRLHGGVDGSNFEFSKWKVCLVIYHMKGRFKAMTLYFFNNHRTTKPLLSKSLSRRDVSSNM